MSQISNALIFHRDGQGRGLLNFLALDILEDNPVPEHTPQIRLSDIPRMNIRCDHAETLANPCESPNTRTGLLSPASNYHESSLTVPKSTVASRQNWTPAKGGNSTTTNRHLGQQVTLMSSLRSPISEDDTALSSAGDPLSIEESMLTVSELEKNREIHSFSSDQEISVPSGRATKGRLRKSVKRIIFALRHSRSETRAIRRETRATRVVGAILGNFCLLF